MGKTFTNIEIEHTVFIKKQKIFFVATAPKSGKINLSPKGMDSFRIIDKNKIAWLNYTGSGNETAAHLLEDTRMTIMFCSFDVKPLIMRLYGKASALHPDDLRWQEAASLFPDTEGARQIFEMDVELVKTSCGESIPFYSYAGERDALKKWIHKKGEAGIRDYWFEKNTTSLDGKPTDIKKDL